MVLAIGSKPKKAKSLEKVKNVRNKQRRNSPERQLPTKAKKGKSKAAARGE